MDDGIDRIAWSELEHNYGDAADIPGHLRKCAHEDARTAIDALSEVDNLLYHQGGWVCSAASAALPFLIDLAAGKAVHHRHEIVELIGRLAREAVIVESRFLDTGWQPALAASMRRLFALLQDLDPRVRREAALLVAYGIRHPEAVEALRLQWEVETDRVTRWDLVLALGVVQSQLREDVGLRAGLEQLLDDDDLQIRLAAVHALAESYPALAASHVDTLVRAVQHDDAALWQESAWIGGSRIVLTTHTGALLEDDTVAAIAYTIGISSGGETGQRVATMEQAGRLLAKWRTVNEAILPFLAEHLHDTEVEVRFQAAFQLACLGSEAAVYADLLATHIDDRAARDSRNHVTVGDAAVWALARQHDPRCVPGLVERLTGKRLGFDTTASYFGRNTHLLWIPAIGEVLIPLREFAPALIDAAATRLAARGGDRGLILGLCEVIETWGHTAEAAAPAVAQLLGEEEFFAAAARALGGIGPAGAEFAHDLVSRAGEASAAWALWRTGADPELGSRELIRRVTGNPGRHQGIRLLADLGPRAAECLDHLRDMARSGDEWLRTEAAHALWRVSGDPAEPVAVLTEIARPLAEGHCLPARIAAMRYLATIGSPAEAATGIARAIIDNPQRIAHSGGWRIFAEDEELRAAAAQLLDQDHAGL